MLRAAFNFQHCPRTNNVAIGATPVDWWTTSGYGPVGLSVNTTAIDADGWLTPCISSGVESIVSFPLVGKTAPGATKITVGFRMKINVIATGAHSVLHFTDPANPADRTFYLLLFGNLGAPWAQTAGATPYVEMTYDIINNITTTFIDGVSVGDYTPPAPPARVKDALLAGNALLVLRLTSTVSARYCAKNIYVADNVAGDDQIVGPLGPQELIPIYVDEVTAVDYVKSDNAKTPLEHLLTPLPTVATLTSTPAKNPLIASLKSDIPAGSRVNGISLGFAGRSMGDSPSPVKVELTQGGITTPAKQVNVPTSMTYGLPVAVLGKALDGGLWTASKIDATTVKLTPETTV